jgi:hypothetical protein
VICRIRVDDIPVIHSGAFGEILGEFGVAVSVDIFPRFGTDEADFVWTKTYDIAVLFMMSTNLEVELAPHHMKIFEQRKSNP